MNQEVSNLKELVKKQEKQIRKLNQKIEKLQSMKNILSNPVPETMVYKQKIAIQLRRTQQIFQLIDSIIERIQRIQIELIEKSRLDESSEEIKSFLNQLKQNSVAWQKSFSSSKNSEDIEEEINKKMDNLDTIINTLLQKHREIAIKNQKYQKQIKSVKSINIQEVNYLKNQLNASLKERDQIAKLLEKGQIEKNQFIVSIKNSANIEFQSLKDKPKDQILQEIKRLIIRIRDIQAQKQEIIVECQKQMEKEIKKYQLILKQVKEMRNTQRNEKSYM